MIPEAFERLVFPDRPSVLVVDDDRTVRMLAEEALGAAGYAVATAEDGEAALALLETLRPDIILLDVLLPGIDGLALCRHLRAAPETRAVPICIMTGLDDIASIREAYEAGATDFIIKPPSWPILIQHLQHLWRSSLIARELAATNVRLEHEIGERKRQEMDLVAARNKLEATLDAIPDLLFEVGLDGRCYDYHCPRMDLLAAPPEVFLGKTVPETLPPDTAAVCMSAIQEAWEQGHSQGKQYELQLPQGPKWFEISVSRKATAPDQEPRFIILSRDITQRKRDEAELRKLSRDESGQRRLAEALRDSAAAMNSTLQLEEVLDRILDNIGRIAVYDAVFIVMLEGEGARLVRHRGLPRPGAANADCQIYRLAELPLLGPLLDTRQPCFITDTLDDPTCAPSCSMIPGTRSCLGIPLEIRGGMVGAIVLTSATPGHFNADSAQQMRAFTSQASVAIDNARLFQEAQRLSVTDGLTGLKNRRHFFDVAKLEYQTRQAVRKAALGRDDRHRPFQEHQ